MPIITFTTDFGLRDPFVGIMRGVVLRICPIAQLVDLTHDVAPQDIREAGLALESAAPFFPSGTIHVAVVDPGVGTTRRAMALHAAGHYFVGPDNGLFTFALGGREWTAVSLENETLRLPAVSRTFHGRDIFAPAAGHLAVGVPLDDFGPPIADPVRLTWPECRREGEDLLGEVIGADRFGNLLTNVTEERLQEFGGLGAVAVSVAGRELAEGAQSYAEGQLGVPAPIVGSTGRLEIFVKNGSAASVLNAGRGALVAVRRVR